MRMPLWVENILVAIGYVLLTVALYETVIIMTDCNRGICKKCIIQNNAR